MKNKIKQIVLGKKQQHWLSETCPLPLTKLEKSLADPVTTEDSKYQSKHDKKHGHLSFDQINKDYQHC